MGADEYAARGWRIADNTGVSVDETVDTILRHALH
jgi:hypothetical protein